MKNSGVVEFIRVKTVKNHTGPRNHIVLVAVFQEKFPLLLCDFADISEGP